jgi:cytochrome c oxidase subunit 3
MYAFLFLFYQYTEYVEAFHQVNDGVFGSTMYMLTSFHGAHVVIGVIMLLTSLIRFYRGHFQPTSTLGFTLSG